MLLRRNYNKKKDMIDREWHDFENHTAWWEKEQPLAPLPKELQTLLDQNDPAFIEQLFEFLFYNESQSIWSEKLNRYTYANDVLKKERSWLWSLYLMDKPLARQGLLRILNYIAPQEFVRLRDKTKVHMYHGGYYIHKDRVYRYALITKYYFRYLKAIYKLAEKKRDIPVWSMLAYRFDVERHYFNPLIYAKTNKTPTTSLKPETRGYLTRRSWRTLRNLGTQGSADYIEIATELLLKYSTEDGKIITVVHPETNKPQSFLSYTRLWLLNHLLYHHSTRFTYGSSTWQAIPHAHLEDTPETREEAFPTLWDQHPNKLLHLLLHAEAPPVIHFAGRALRLGNPHFVTNLSEELLQELFQSTQPLRRDFAVREWLNRMDKFNPDLTKWFSFFMNHHADVRKLAIQYLNENHQNWTKECKQQLIKTCFDSIKKVSDQPAILHDWLNVFQSEFQSILPEVVSLSMLLPLLKQSNTIVSELLMFLLPLIDQKNHPFTAEELLPFLQAEDEPTRQTARQILHEQFIQLSCTPAFFVQLVAIPYEDNLVFVTPFFADRMLWMVPFLPEFIELCWNRLLQPACPEIVKNYIQHDLLGTLFLSELIETPLTKVLALISSDELGLQELGARILSVIKPDPKALHFDQLLRLAHNQIALARLEARNLIIQIIDRVSDEWLVHLVETDWDDTRNWAFSYMRTLSVEQFTPTLIYGLLDSARKDVQDFAMQMVEIHFHDLDITELLLRASESTDLFVQEYALSLAEKISWDITQVKKLEYFFRSLLFRVYQARNAKDRLLALLLKLGKMSQPIAETIVPLLADVLQTQGKRDFERILLTLTEIKTTFPKVNSPVQLR